MHFSSPHRSFEKLLCKEGVNTFIDRANQLDPRRYQYSVRPGGHFTRQSLKDWKQRTDKCLEAYKKALSKTKTAAKLNKQLERLGFGSCIDPTQIENLWTRIQMEMDRLKSERNRKGV